ncbi:hypothetical protein F4212_01800, partial [Candidatus Poribacteria bacterium]|nr:hypothetical protein [Candidatus Poribacteria bacterium]
MENNQGSELTNPFLYVFFMLLNVGNTIIETETGIKERRRVSSLDVQANLAQKKLESVVLGNVIKTEKYSDLNKIRGLTLQLVQLGAVNQLQVRLNPALEKGIKITHEILRDHKLYKPYLWTTEKCRRVFQNFADPLLFDPDVPQLIGEEKPPIERFRWITHEKLTDSVIQYVANSVVKDVLGDFYTDHKTLLANIIFNLADANKNYHACLKTQYELVTMMQTEKKMGSPPPESRDLGSQASKNYEMWDKALYEFRKNLAPLTGCSQYDRKSLQFEYNRFTNNSVEAIGQRHIRSYGATYRLKNDFQTFYSIRGAKHYFSKTAVDRARAASNKYSFIKNALSSGKTK